MRIKCSLKTFNNVSRWYRLEYVFFKLVAIVEGCPINKSILSENICNWLVGWLQVLSRNSRLHVVRPKFPTFTVKDEAWLSRFSYISQLLFFFSCCSSSAAYIHLGLLARVFYTLKEPPFLALNPLFWPIVQIGPSGIQYTGRKRASVPACSNFSLALIKFSSLFNFCRGLSCQLLPSFLLFQLNRKLRLIRKLLLRKSLIDCVE